MIDQNDRTSAGPAPAGPASARERRAETPGRPAPRPAPEALAARFAGAGGKPALERLVAAENVVRRPELRERFATAMREERYRDALRTPLNYLGGWERDDVLRRQVFRLLETRAWRRKLMPVLRGYVQRNPSKPMPAALFLYGVACAGRPLDTGLVSPLVWSLTLPWLLDYCTPTLLQPYVAKLAQDFPKISFLGDVAQALEHAPPPRVDHEFHDGWNADVQFVRAPGGSSTRLLVCFSGAFGRMGMSITTFDRWLAHQPTHVLYLKDMSRAFYRDGVTSLGPGPESTVSFIRELTRLLGIEEVSVYGISMGGPAALDASLELGARRMVWAAGAVERSDKQARWNDPAEAEQRRAVGQELLARLEQASHVPEIVCIYGENFSIDAEIPEILAAHPAVRLVPISGLNHHNIDFHLAKGGRLDRLIAWVAADAEGLDLG